MNTQTLKIQIPWGFEIDSFDKQSGEIRFKEKPKPAMERIKTISDLLADHGYTHERFDKLCADLSADEKAYRLLKLLAVSLNEGWTPNWSNYNEYKYYPWFELDGSSGFRYGGYDRRHSGSAVGSRLCFKSRELAEYAGKQFIEVYKQFMLIH